MNFVKRKLITVWSHVNNKVARVHTKAVFSAPFCSLPPVFYTCNFEFFDRTSVHDLVEILYSLSFIKAF